MNLIAPARVFALSCLGLSLSTASCVSPQQHDEALAQVKAYQSRVFDLEKLNDELRRELENLRTESTFTEVTTVESSYDSSAFDAKLREYELQLAGLGRPLEDIERFDVEGGYVYMVQDAVLFASGQSSVSAEGKTALESLARDIATQPYGRVWVRGHTDSDPVRKPSTLERFPHGNLQLSAERAVEVGVILSQRGMLDSTRVAVAGFGPHEPLKPNDSAENKRLNRRCEIFVSDN